MRCELCELSKTCNSVMIDAFGTGSIVFLGEAPGAEEDQLNQPFVGQSGKLLKECLEGAEIPLESVRFTYSVRCKPPANKAPSAKETKICSRSHLSNEFSENPPKIVIPLGNTALSALREIGYLKIPGTITQLQGQAIETELSDGSKVVIIPMFHPSYIMRTNDFSSYEKSFPLLISIIESGGKVQQTECDYFASQDLEELKLVIEEIKNHSIVSYDIETSCLHPKDPNAFVISFAFTWQTNQGFSFYLTDDNRETAWNLIHDEILENDKIKKIIQHAKFELLWSMAYGRTIKNMDDTMLLHWHTNDKNGTHSLDKLALEFTDMGFYDAALEMYKKEHKEADPGKMYKDPETGEHRKGSYANIPKDILCLYNAQDTDATFRVHKIIKPMLTEKQLWIHDNIQIPSCYPLAAMELQGVNIDWEYTADLDEILPTQSQLIEKSLFDYPQVQKLHNDIIAAGGEGFSASSPDQISKLLFKSDYFSFPSVYKTDKGKDSTDKTALQFLAERDTTGIVEKILEIRRINTLYNTFVKGAVARERNGRIHTSYGMAHTETGRFNSRDPNLQNIPRDKLIKNMYIPNAGEWYVQCDYSQVELRVMALFSGDKTLLQYFKDNVDVHRYIAAKIHKKDPNEITKEERVRAKRTVFGLCYGQGARGLSEELKISEKEADTFLKKFFKEFPSVEKWINSTKKAANKNGYVETFFGRRRRLPDAMLKDDFHSAKNRAMRQAINQPIQGTAADILSLKMTDVYNFIKSEKLKTQMMLTVHDSLGFSVPPDELNFFVSMAKVIVEDFSSLPEIKVPILCDFEIGKRWGELTPIDKLGFQQLEQGVDIELILERLNNG